MDIRGLEARIIVSWFVFSISFVTAHTAESIEKLTGRAIIEAAFANLYDLDFSSKVELVARAESGQELIRHLDIATKTIGGRVHSIGRLSAPNRLRGMTVLMIEADGRRHDAFVFFPAMGRVRRISTAQRSDSFFGTDVTYEDLERRHSDEYEVTNVRELARDGEVTYEVTVFPLKRRNYERATFGVAKSDFAILATEFFKRNAASPYRVIRAPRKSMVMVGEHILPTRLRVEDRSAKSWTEVRFRNLRVDREIDDHLFSVGNLIKEWDLPTQRAIPPEGGDGS